MTETETEKYNKHTKYICEWQKNKYKNDPIFREEKNKYMNEFNKNKYKNDAVFREKIRVYNKELYDKKKLMRAQELAESKLKDNLKIIEDQLENLTTI